MSKGKPVIKIRQSALKDWLLCSERFRSVAAGEVYDEGSDAALTGTGAHAAIQARIEGSPTDEAIVIGLTVLRDGWDQVAHVKTQKLATAESHLINCYTTWEAALYPQLGNPLMVEQHFEVPIHETPDYIVVFSGTIDHVDDCWGATDWKTCGDLRKYLGGFGNDGWQLKRWDVQSTIYTYALTRLTGEPHNEFTFMALHRTQPDFAVLTVQRDERHWNFAIQQACEMAAAIWRGVGSSGPWQRNDQHALCSEDWCPNWGNCKGAISAHPY